MGKKSFCPLCVLRSVRPTSRGAAGLAFIPLSWLYGIAVRLRLFGYSSGLLRQERVAGARVISIGNITVGGTGKTPVTVMLAKMLGPGTAIVSRGYGRKSHERVQVVADGRQIIGSYPEAADEALLCAVSLKTVPVICAPRRSMGIRAVVERFGTKTVLLDDAFSHLAASRDRNLLLLDALDPFGGDRLLPAGRLREPVSSLQRADALMITRANFLPHQKVEEIRGRVQELARNGAPIFTCDIAAEEVVLPGGERAPAKNYLAGKTVRLLSGIASPAQFEDTIRGFGAIIGEHNAFPDHHHFSEEELSRAFQGRAENGLLLTTEKDLMRIPDRFRPQFHVLAITARVKEEKEFREWLSHWGKYFPIRK